jgi:hypothetical protein
MKSLYTLLREPKNLSLISTILKRVEPGESWRDYFSQHPQEAKTLGLDPSKAMPQPFYQIVSSLRGGAIKTTGGGGSKTDASVADSSPASPSNGSASPSLAQFSQYPPKLAAFFATEPHGEIWRQIWDARDPVSGKVAVVPLLNQHPEWKTQVGQQDIKFYYNKTTQMKHLADYEAYSAKARANWHNQKAKKKKPAQAEVTEAPKSSYADGTPHCPNCGFAMAPFNRAFNAMINSK